jgi:hypothetical protein
MMAQLMEQHMLEEASCNPWLIEAWIDEHLRTRRASVASEADVREPSLPAGP